MSITYVASFTAQSATGATSVTMTTPVGAAAGDLAILAVGFEGRAAGSGPWIDPSTATPINGVMGEGSGWTKLLHQAPSATGNGLEVWAALLDPVPQTHQVIFTGSYNAIAVESLYRGVYAPGGLVTEGAVRLAEKQQWTGDDPECPDVYVYTGERVVAIAAQQLLSPGFGDPTPDGWTTRTDGKRASTFGNVEVAIADMFVTEEGPTGVIPFNANSASGSNKGATATLAIRPSPPASTSPLILVEYAVPT